MDTLFLAMRHILGQIVAFKRTGSLLVSGLTAGIKTRKENVQLLGPHAQTVVDGKPTLYFIPPKQEADAGVNYLLGGITMDLRPRSMRECAVRCASNLLDTTDIVIQLNWPRWKTHCSHSRRPSEPSQSPTLG
jgi:hypothetical protein